MKKLLFILFPSLLLSCMWVDGTTIDGEYTNQSKTVISNTFEYYIKESSSAKQLANIFKNEPKHKKRTESEQEEHDAIVFLLKGEYEKSIQKLLALNKKHKNKYSIASNLGTAYELNGNNVEALKWITEGIKRDADSHYGTEWLHQLILEIKIILTKNPKFLETNKIITLPNEFTEATKITINHKTYSIYEIERALEYQLRERTVFVKPKDAIVADLFYTLARIGSQTSSVETGLAYLEWAELYGFSQTKLLEDKKEFYQNIKESPSISYYFHKIFQTDTIVWIILLSLLGIVAILVKRVLFFLYKKLFK